MQPILNSNISVTFSVKYNCNMSKSKLVFPLSNESYFGLIALLVRSYHELNRSHPVYVLLGFLWSTHAGSCMMSLDRCIIEHLVFSHKVK